MNQTPFLKLGIKMTLCGMWMTLEVILHLINNLRLHYVGIHINFHQNWFINDCARKILAIVSVFLWDVEELTFLEINDIELMFVY